MVTAMLPLQQLQELTCQADLVRLGSASNRPGDLGQVTVLPESLSAVGATTELSPSCCCSVAKSSPTLCDPMDPSKRGFPVLPCLPELAQPHVH